MRVVALMVRIRATERELQKGDERVPTVKDGPGAARGVHYDVGGEEFAQTIPVLRIDVREVACLELLDRFDLEPRVGCGRRVATKERVRVRVGDTDADTDAAEHCGCAQSDGGAQSPSPA